MKKMHIATVTVSFSVSTKTYCLSYLSCSSAQPQSMGLETEMERRNCTENDMVENVLIPALGK